MFCLCKDPDSKTYRTDGINPRNYSLEDVHIQGAERIAEAVAKYDVDRFIHVSSYNADPSSPSEFFATKVGRLQSIVYSPRADAIPGSG